MPLSSLSGVYFISIGRNDGDPCVQFIGYFYRVESRFSTLFDDTCFGCQQFAFCRTQKTKSAMV